MFFIYSIDLNDLSVKLYDFCRTSLNVKDMLDTVCKDFIRREQGERQAENPYRNDVTDEQITEDGYFLRNSTEKVDQIDVYQRKTTQKPGYVYTSYDVICKKVMIFSVTEASLGLPTYCTGTSITTKSLSNGLDASTECEHLRLLKEKVAVRRAQIEEQMRTILPPAEYQLPEVPEFSDDDDEPVSNPIRILQQRVLAELQAQRSLTPPPLADNSCGCGCECNCGCNGNCDNECGNCGNCGCDSNTHDCIIDIPLPPPLPVCNYYRVSHFSQVIRDFEYKHCMSLPREQLIRLFKKVDRIYNLVKPQTRLNFINMPYVLFKLLQHINFPFILSDFDGIVCTPDKIKYHDKIWKNITQVLHWPFKKTTYARLGNDTDESDTEYSDSETEYTPI